MKSYKRMTLIWAIIVVGLGCLGAGALLVLERPVTHQLLATTLSSARGTAGPSVSAPAPVRQDSHPSAADRKRIEESYARIPLSFEANAGQTDSRVKFLSRGRGYTLFLAGDDAVLTLRSASSDVRGPLPSRGGKHHLSQRTPNIEPQTPDSLVRMRLVGANASAAVTGVDELPGKANYFLGNDPKKWRTNVPTYSQVRYRNVYPGIDLVYHGNQGGQLQYDFVVAPGAEPQAIALAVGAVGESRRTRGDAPVRIARDGDLVIPAKSGELRFRKPVAYQEESKIENRRLVEAHFTLDAQNRVHFALGPFDHTQPLVIDPSLLWATYLGGSGTDSCQGIAVDSSGNAYVTGYTASTNFPAVNPINQTVYEGGSSTTYSGASLAGGNDAFVAKLTWNSSTSTLSLAYSTYMGGTANDNATGIAVDSLGNAYVTGWTASNDFPVLNWYQEYLVGPWTVFVTELNSTGSIVFSTYLGGSGGVVCSGTCGTYGDVGEGIAVAYFPETATNPTPYVNAYLTGYTSSSDFPISPGAPTCTPVPPDTSCTPTTGNFVGPSLTGGSQNAFVTELNWVPSSTTLSLVYSTYLGGSYMDGGYGIAVDSSGNAYVTGTAYSSNFPTVNPLDQSVLENGAPVTYAGGYLIGFQNAFVAEVNWVPPATPSLTGVLSLVYSTYLGGTGGDTGYGIAVDSSGNAYVTGVTQSVNFPIINPVQKLIGGSGDAFVAKLNWTASATTPLTLVYSTYLGGSGWDIGYGIAVDSSANAYVSGYTSSSDFPTAQPIQKSLVGTSNAFVAELNWAAGTSTLSSVYSTYLGGGGDYGYGIAVDSSKNAYVAGLTDSSVFPTLHSLQGYGGGGAPDGFVAEISATTAPSPAAGVTLGTTVCTSGTPCATLGFGNVQKSYSSTKSVTLVSSGTGSLTLSSITISSGTGFSLTTGTSVCPYSGGVIAKGATCNIYVKFSPTAVTSYNGTVTITDNASTSPQTITLTGTGTSSPPPPGGGKTTTTITSHSPNPSIVGQGVRVKFKVSSNGTPTGTVTVSDGTGDTCVVDVGTGNCVLTPTTAGTKTLTAVYSGDSNFSGSTSTGVSQTVTAFTISAFPRSETAKAGTQASFQVTVTSLNGFQGNVSFTCSGAPSSCSFSHNPLSISSGSGPGQTVAVLTTTLSTTPGTYKITFAGKYGTGSPASGGETQKTTAKLTVY